MVLQTYIVSVIIFLTSTFYYFVKRKYSYWNKRGIKGPPPIPILGNFKNVMLFKQTTGDLTTNIYEDFPDEKVVGIYRGFQPILIVRDPALISQVLIKDFSVFQDRGLKTSKNPLFNNLFSAEGEIWQVLRQKLTPIFTSKKLKDMTPLIDDGIDNYINYVNGLVESNEDHEIKSLTAKYTLQVIGYCAFGLELDTYSNEDAEYKRICKKIFNTSKLTKILNVLTMFIPGLGKITNDRTDADELLNFFVNVVRGVMLDRQDKPLTRRDFMDFMIELKRQGHASKKKEDGVLKIEIDDILIAAQASIFYSAGFETSSTTMAFLLYELALHQDIQDRIYKEICHVLIKCNGKLTFDFVKDMKYLEMAFDETLRKHSAAGVLHRICSENYTFPGTTINIEKGTPIFIPSQGLHNDPKYFSNPKEYNPDRFKEGSEIEQCVYLPFGEGPRKCIGIRFAKIVAIMGMTAFLKDFKVEAFEKTTKHMKYDPTGLTLIPLEGIYLKIVKR